VIGAILMQQDQFFRLNEAGMRDAAARSGADLKVQNAGGALDKEASILDTYITQKVDAVLVSPLSTQASIPALRRAADRGIKVVTYNNGIAADFPVCNIQSDQEALGASTGKAAREYIETRLGGKAKVVLIGFASQLPEQGGARQRGFRAGLEGLPGVEIVAEQDAWNAPEAATTVGALLGKIAVFGTDVSAQLIDFLLAGDGILQAVTAQKPFEMGASAVEAAVSAAKGEPVRKELVLPGLLFSRDRPDELREYRKSLSEESR
jgi:ABC-type sugar transport system substrate-binding protein